MPTLIGIWSVMLVSFDSQFVSREGGMPVDVMVDGCAGGYLRFGVGVVEQHGYLRGLFVDAVDEPGVEDRHVVE